jgi:hypothetical protein
MADQLVRHKEYEYKNIIKEREEILAPENLEK